MSTTLDRRVALQYAGGDEEENAGSGAGGLAAADSGATGSAAASGYAVGPTAPGLVFEMRMGMIDRGADLTILSQYPHEREGAPRVSYVDPSS